MNKSILIASTVALALSLSACNREERTVTDLRGAPPNAATEPQSSTASSTSSAPGGQSGTALTPPGSTSSAPAGSTSAASSSGDASMSPSSSAVGGTSTGAGGSVAMGSDSTSAGAVGATSSEAGGGSGAELLKAKGCTNCHDNNTKKVGPAFKDIAAKKPSKDAVVAKLKEGKGHMKVNASEAEINTMVETVLSTK